MPAAHRLVAQLFLLLLLLLLCHCAQRQPYVSLCLMMDFDRTTKSMRLHCNAVGCCSAARWLLQAACTHCHLQLLHPAAPASWTALPVASSFAMSGRARGRSLSRVL
jgi:hypothetical protein